VPRHNSILSADVAYETSNGLVSITGTTKLVISPAEISLLFFSVSSLLSSFVEPRFRSRDTITCDYGVHIQLLHYVWHKRHCARNHHYFQPRSCSPLSPVSFRGFGGAPLPNIFFTSNLPLRGRPCWYFRWHFNRQRAFPRISLRDFPRESISQNRDFLSHRDTSSTMNSNLVDKDITGYALKEFPSDSISRFIPALSSIVGNICNLSLSAITWFPLFVSDLFVLRAILQDTAMLCRGSVSDASESHKKISFPRTTR